MKKLFFLYLLAWITWSVNAQEKGNLGLLTDRDWYTSGESILLTVATPPEDPSGLVHVDLLDLHGHFLNGMSQKIVDHQANGFIAIPDSIRTGSYLLCASTRNHAVVTLREILVANRFAGIPESGTVERPAELKPLTANRSDLIVDGLSAKMATTAKNRIILHLSPNSLAELTGNLTVSIAESNASFKPGYGYLTVPTPPDSLIEKEGVIVDGQLTNLGDGKPFAKGMVFLSIPDTLPRFKYFITGDDGRFSFELGHFSGSIPLVVQGFDPQRKHRLKISLNRWEQREYPLSAPVEWKIPADLKRVVEESSDAVMFRRLFNQKEYSLALTHRPDGDRYPFYGVPHQVIDPHLYIDLPNFTEISRELLPGVKFRAYNRNPTLQVFDMGQRNLFTVPPLVLIDGIPVRDLALIKELGTKEIKRIELCLTERFYGDLTFPGVVAIYTLKPDDSRVPASDDLLKLQQAGIQQPVEWINTPLRQPHQPDLRKVLYWNPKVKPLPEIGINFETSHIRGTFRLVVRGIKKDGSLLEKEQLFEVN